MMLKSYILSIKQYIMVTYINPANQAPRVLTGFTYDPLKISAF